MILYGYPGTRTVRALWALETARARYDLVSVDLSKGEGRSAEFLAINPNGKVPVLIDGDLTLSESAAICIYLGERRRMPIVCWPIRHWRGRGKGKLLADCRPVGYSGTGQAGLATGRATSCDITTAVTTMAPPKIC